MTVQEAIRELHNIRPLGGIIPQKRAEAIDIAIKSMEEVEQYRALGTVEELKEAREKQIPKKSKSEQYFYGILDRCPVCEGGLYYEQKYCDDCGQALKWGEEDD